MTENGTLWDGDAALIAVFGGVAFFVGHAMLPLWAAAGLAVLAVVVGFGIISILNTTVEAAK